MRAGNNNHAEETTPPTIAKKRRRKPAHAFASRKSRHKHIRQQIADHGEDHGQPPERPHFSNRTGLMREEADQENRDLSLNAIEDRVGREMFAQAKNFLSIRGIFGRIKIDFRRGITSQKKVLQKRWPGLRSRPRCRH